MSWRSEKEKEPVLRKKQGIETGLGTEAVRKEKRGLKNALKRKGKAPIFYLTLFLFSWWEG